VTLPEVILMVSEPSAPFDTTTAHPARRYNYWLGGKENFAADRASADAIEQLFPSIRVAAVENRRFLQRAVRDLVKDEGVRQFLDIGTGLPTADNSHEVAQRLAPNSRIVCVDNDPLVLSHARALLTSDPAGRVSYLHADLRTPEQIITHPDLGGTLDPGQPVALLLVAVLHFLTDADQPHAIVRALVDALAPGSFLVVSHATYDVLPVDTAQALTAASPPSLDNFTPRSREQIDRFFDRLALLPPGLQVVSDWRPEPGSPSPPPQQVAVYGAVARKPEQQCT
jgi:SAM-dependent methyltransferase